jgi:hypothetical protein
MRALTTLAAAGLVAVAIPAGAVAQTATGTDCTYSDNAQTRIATLPHLVVYAETGNGGMTGTALAAGGVCANGLGITTPVNHLDGFTVEAGVGTPVGGPGVYAVGDGDNHNTDILGVTDGYGGVSNYETGSKGQCNSPPGTGSNSGGCLEYSNVRVPVPAPVACGDTSGNTWSTTNRDGCSIP